MNNSFLFAIDQASEEIIISNSPKNTNKIHFLERIKRQDNEMLYNSVLALTEITKSTNFNMKTFNSMNKVCQTEYTKHKEIKE
jgi:hypothetical protein